MNAYVASVIDYVKTTHGNEPEFVQTVEEVLSSISPIMDAHPEYEKVDLLKRMVEPERMFTFRVCWMAYIRRSFYGASKRDNFQPEVKS